MKPVVVWAYVYTDDRGRQRITSDTITLEGPITRELRKQAAERIFAQIETRMENS